MAQSRWCVATPTPLVTRGYVPWGAGFLRETPLSLRVVRLLLPVLFQRGLPLLRQLVQLCLMDPEKTTTFRLLVQLQRQTRRSLRLVRLLFPVLFLRGLPLLRLLFRQRSLCAYGK